MTPIQQAREALGGRLREVRRRAGLTGVALAERLGCSQAKVSKLENGRQTPTDTDIREWCAACGAAGGQAVEALLASLHTLEVRHAEWKRVLAGGSRSHQDEIAAQSAKTRQFRVFEPSLIPGLIQVAGYAREIMSEGIASLRTPNDIDDAVAARMARQDILYDTRRAFNFVLTEAALRYGLCPPEVMLAQLDRLMTATTLPNVKLGIIPFGTRLTRVPLHGFWIIDDRLVQVETFTAELNLAQPEEVEAYAAAFRRFAGDASYGAAARSVIAAVTSELRAGLGEDEDAREG